MKSGELKQIEIELHSIAIALKYICLAIGIIWWTILAGLILRAF